MSKKNRQGQSTLEYAFLLAVIIFAILTVQIYVRRGLIGRMRDTADQQFGSQFDPYSTTGKIHHKAGGTTHDVLDTTGKSTSDFAADAPSTQLEEYTSPEKVNSYSSSTKLSDKSDR